MRISTILYWVVFVICLFLFLNGSLIMTTFATKGLDYEVNLTIPTFVAFIILFSYLVFNSRKIPNTKLVRSVVLVLFYTCFISYLHPDTILSRSTYWILPLPLLIFIMLVKFINNGFNQKLVLYSSIIIMLLLAISYFKNYSILLYNIINTSEIVTNTSYFILYFLPFVLCLKDGIVKKCLLLLVITIVVISAKRGAFIALALALILYFVLNYYIRIKSEKKTTHNFIFLIFFLGIVLVFVGAYILQNSELYIIERLLSIGDDGGSGRTDIWKQVIEEISNSSFINLLFGHGYDSVIKVQQIGYSAHNDFLEVIYDFGILAFLLYLNLHFKLIGYIIRLFNAKNQLTAPLAVSYVLFLLSSLIAHIYIYIYYMTIFCIFWAFVYASNKLDHKL